MGVVLAAAVVARSSRRAARGQGGPGDCSMIDHAAARAYGDAMSDLEEKLAHLMRSVDDLSDVIARQDREIDGLRGRVQMLLEREAARRDESEGSVFLGDERPPHY